MTDATPKIQIDLLPLILAGPMLRRSTVAEISVWVALRLPAAVTLRVHQTSDDGNRVENSIASGHRQTVTVGESLHLVTVTARHQTGKEFLRGEIYAYDLEFTIGDTKYNLAQALGSGADISYFEHQLPTFLLPPLDLDGVKIAHGSCRKPHGDGRDALAILDRILASNADIVDRRPQQLFLTGDQIYGDDVADPLLWVASHVGAQILGWDEELPVGKWDKPKYLTTQELPSGKRSEIATKNGGFTAGLHQKRSKVTSHLFGLGEYCAAYLLAWSPVVWPDYLPSAKEMARAGREVDGGWDREVADMRSFISSLPAVRRVLANIATYTIFDDHDVSDDWNLNQAWCLRVLGKPLGRRVVSNALLAYSLFQAWGNTPDRFEAGEHGDRLLGLLSELINTRGYDEFIEQEIGRYVGMPPRQPRSNLPEFIIDGKDWVLAKDPQALVWDYTIDCGSYQAIVCDTRTQRAYPYGRKNTSPPRLLSESALITQIVDRIGNSNINGKELVLILPTNLFGLEAIDWVHHHQLKRGKVFGTDVGDAWNIRLDAVAQLLDNICRDRPRTLVLTGDIHYAGAVEFIYQPKGDSSTQIVQFTASACKNEELITRILQSKFKTWLLPERKRACTGTTHPPQMQWRSRFKFKQQTQFLPQWQGKLHPLKYQAIAPNQTDKTETNRSRQWLRALRRYLYNGGEVIGCNNIAIVGWDGDDKHHALIQDVYWLDPHSPTPDNPISIARYRV
jgi:hypothetical protein